MIGELPTLAQGALLAGAGVAAGFVNTLAGGGSVLTVPVLMLLGLPGDVANGTSRVSIVAQSLTGAWGFARGGKLSLGAALEVVPLALLGAVAGAYVATILPNAIFEPLLLGTMLVMAATIFVRPAIFAAPPGAEPRSIRARPLASLALLAAGFYGGMLQAGVGLILIALLGGLLHYDLLRANALKVTVVLAYSIPALVVFVIRDKVSWIPALVLTGGNVLGAWLAVHTALRRGERFVKVVFFMMVFALCVILAARAL